VLRYNILDWSQKKVWSEELKTPWAEVKFFKKEKMVAFKSPPQGLSFDEYEI